jgi:DNA-binding PadR family transcriptional regulator
MTSRLPPHWFQILLSLADRPRHGLAIIDDISEQTGGRIRLWPGVLYVALKKMTTAGLVANAATPPEFTATAGRPRFFRITPRGLRACKDEAEHLAAVVEAARARRLLGPRTR